MYCVKCEKITDTSNEQYTVSKNGRNMKRGICVICGKTKTQFIKTQKGGSLLNKFINNLPVEMHLPGHNFTGPGTKLNKRLNPDLTPKKWSKPINRVDKAAYHHEFYNKDVKDLIELYSTENEEKSSVVERWIRTMKEKMWKYLTANSTNAYLNVLSDLVKEYNNTRHSSIKMTPTNASKKGNELTVWRNLYPEHLEIRDIYPKFSVGDKVRISKKKKTFEKGYTTRWTEEIFTIVEVKHTSPQTYKIADLNGEEIKGTFYEPELQKTSQELFRIEKVIKRGKTKSLVKWKGYSWVDNKNIVNIS